MLSVRHLRQYASHPHPVADFAEAVQCVNCKRAAEVGFAPDSQSILLTHGGKTARAYDYDAEFDIIPDVAHDSMLDTRWQSVAERIRRWLHEREM